jgi:hypothetical protein
VCALVLSAALAWHLLHKPTIYLVDYIAQRPDDRCDALQALELAVAAAAVAADAAAAGQQERQCVV